VLAFCLFFNFGKYDLSEGGTMLRALNKASGALAGGILYPIKSLFVNALFITGTALLALVLLIGLPILFAVATYQAVEENKFREAFFSWLAIGFLAVVVGLPILAAIFIAEIYLTYKDLIRSFVFGIVDGYEEGLFFHVINRAITSFLVFSKPLQLITVFVILLVRSSTYRDASAQMNGNAFAQLMEPAKEGVDFTPLSREEIELANGNSELKDLLARYKDLHQRLKNLDDLIGKRAESANDTQDLNQVALDYEAISDELTQLEIFKPALIVKLYEAADGTWCTVPGTTKIIDHTNLQKWVEKSNTHPETREPLDNADPHQGFRTRYAIVPYTNGMKSAQELVETAVLIRNELKKTSLDNMPTPSEIVKGSLAQIKDRFFSSEAAANDETDSKTPAPEHSGGTVPPSYTQPN